MSRRLSSPSRNPQATSEATSHHGGGREKERPRTEREENEEEGNRINLLFFVLIYLFLFAFFRKMVFSEYCGDANR